MDFYRKITILKVRRGVNHYSIYLIYTAVRTTCYEGQTCSHVNGVRDLITKTKDALLEICSKDEECKAIEYNDVDGKGRLCTSTTPGSASTNWQRCVITGI